MAFVRPMTALSLFRSFFSGFLALTEAIIFVPLLLLRSVGLIKGPETTRLARRQDRLSRMRWIGSVLSANAVQPTRPLLPHEANLLVGELDRLFDEELADLRAAEAARLRDTWFWLRLGWAFVGQGWGLLGRARDWLARVRN